MIGRIDQVSNVEQLDRRKNERIIEPTKEASTIKEGKTKKRKKPGRKEEKLPLLQ